MWREGTVEIEENEPEIVEISETDVGEGTEDDNDENIPGEKVSVQLYFALL